MKKYEAPRETGEPTTRVPRHVMERAKYLERVADSSADGKVSAEQYVSQGPEFTFGYDLPVGSRFDPAGLYDILSTARRADVPKDVAYRFVVEYVKTH